MESVAGAFEWFADWAEGVAPLYERLARATATDERLLAIAAESPPGQPAPNLLLAAVHALLLEGSDHRLAAFYPTCRSDPLAPDETDPFPAFREFVVRHEDAIRDLVGSRRVQTNAVGRSAVLFPAFKYVGDSGAEGPLALVEIGASAGLNLHWDRFQYEYAGTGVYGSLDSPVRVQSEVRGDVDPPLWDRTPAIGERVGIDINPLDVTDPADARWLRALVIPDQQWRFEQLESAIELAREDPPRLVAGDALDVLPDVLADIPDRFDVCVFSTLVLYQFEDEEIDRLRDLLAEESRQRPIHWLSNDPAGGQTPPVYRHVAFDRGETRTRRLAEYKSHGEWIRWLDGDEAPA